jgi:hypothetical protein
VRVDVSQLPVDVFDDSTFETATPAAWMRVSERSEELCDRALLSTAALCEYLAC